MAQFRLVWLQYFPYFLVTFVTYAVLRINEPEKATVPVINVRNIDRLSYLSIITPILIFSLFIGLHGLNAVKNPIAIRAFWESGGMAYVSQIYQFATIIMFYVLYKKSYSSKVIILVFILHFAISAVAGRPGWIINYFIVIIFLRYIFLNSNSLFWYLHVVLSYLYLAYFHYHGEGWRRSMMDLA